MSWKAGLDMHACYFGTKVAYLLVQIKQILWWIASRGYNKMSIIAHKGISDGRRRVFIGTEKVVNNCDICVAEGGVGFHTFQQGLKVCK